MLVEMKGGFALKSVAMAKVRRFSRRHVNALMLAVVLCALLLLLALFLPRPEPTLELPRLEAVIEDGMHGGRIDINHADVALFSELPGIGERLAQTIVDYREMYGDFERVDDLLQVKGIGVGKLEGIRAFICCGEA